MKYPIGIQTFESIREEGDVYVDKTALIYQLANDCKYYSLSRPRRFGKSLLISTLKAYFSGQEDLFKGLAIEKLETKWEKYPVLHMDLTAGDYATEHTLTNKLNSILADWEAIYGSSPSENSPSSRFAGIVERAYEKTGKRVVILVDEYDKPLLATVDKPELNDSYYSTLESFYCVTKSQDRYIHFALFTGVTKVTCRSPFSGFNNLYDISMHPDYVDICGISEKELHTYFDAAIKELAAANKMTYEETCNKLQKKYGGYHFCEDTIGIYNPNSLLNTFQDNIFNDYWFETGTPTFLTKLLKNYKYKLDNLQGMVMSYYSLNSVNSMQENIISPLYLSGYLTIKDYDKEDELYVLDFPNLEVEKAFKEILLPYYAHANSTPESSSSSE